METKLDRKLERGFELIQEIHTAMTHLIHLVDDDESGDDVNECLSKSYPFESSLDEYDTSSWVNDYKEKMYELIDPPTIPITYGVIKLTFGWSRFCEVTGGNPYAINDFGDYNDNEIFDITHEQARLLGIIS